jgi:hypothetical protein
MHQYVTGHWAASSYNVKGERTDHQLFLSTEGLFEWNMRKADGTEQHSSGSWNHDANQDVLTFRHSGDESKVVSWAINYVSGCEASNLILVLRWLALAGRNLPILFTRIHPPNDPVWRINDDQHR